MKTSETSRERGILLVVGPGPEGRGGIAAVIEMHRQSAAWSQWGGTLLSTYDDRSRWHKVRAALHAWVAAPVRVLRADIVHIHLAAQISLYRKLPIVAFARLLRKPLIVHLHAATEASLFTHTSRTAVRFVFLSATRAIALSESWAAILRKHIPEARVSVLPNPVLSRELSAREPAVDPIILLVGKLEPRKGYADLLAAASIVLHEFPAARFWFAGHGEIAQARTRAEELGIDGSVRFLGWLDRVQLDEIYAQTQILTLPSYGEGVPMSVIEAMSHAIPVVCTPVGGVPEWIDHERNGLLTEPGDIPGLAAQILRLLRDRAFATWIGQAGRDTVQERCTLEMISSRLDALYTEVLTAQCQTS